MKIHFMAFFLFFCLSNPLRAQFSLGGMAGLNFSNLSYKNLPDYIIEETEGVVYQYFGLIPKFQLNNKWSVSTNLEFSQKGRKTSFVNLENERANFRNRNTYLDIMPKVEYHPIPAISLGVGMYAGLVLKNEFSYNEGSWRDNNGENPYSSNDFGVVGSVRGNFKNFFLMVSYNQGLKNLSELNWTDINGEPLTGLGEFNQNIQVGIGYFFDFK